MGAPEHPFQALSPTHSQTEIVRICVYNVYIYIGLYRDHVLSCENTNQHELNTSIHLKGRTNLGLATSTLQGLFMDSKGITRNANMLSIKS